MNLPEYLVISDNGILFSSHIENIIVDAETESLHVYTCYGNYQLTNDDALNFLLQFPCGYFKRAYGIDSFFDFLLDKYGNEEEDL